MIAFVFIFLASAVLLFSPWRVFGAMLLAIGYLVALFNRQMDAVTLVPLGLLFVAASFILARNSQAWLKWFGHGLFIVCCRAFVGATPISWIS